MYALYGIVIVVHAKYVKWEVDLHDDFVPEYDELHEDVQDEPLAYIELLEQFGPRFAFAFDPKRRAIVLCGGDKSGGGEKRFYRY